MRLDPLSDHRRHHYYHPNHYLHQNQFLNFRHVDEEDEKAGAGAGAGREVDGEDQDSSISTSYKDPALHFHLQYLQQNHSYDGLDTELDSLHRPKKRSYLLPPSPPASSFSVEYATKMGESGNHHRRTVTTSSRLAPMRGRVGEIVEVQGGHIVRATGRKDRHSKVCTAKGPRDRRVRLSAHTAIQFYDIQDRLGYDRPSKAVDWLIKNAQAAIDELAKLPAWNPNTTNQNAQQEKDRERKNQPVNENNSPIGVHGPAVDAMDSGGRRTSTAADSGGRIMEKLDENPNRGGGLDFLPPTFDTDIGDSIKSFFSIGVTAAPETNSSSIQFQNYPPDLLSLSSSACQNQDIRLSLQSLQDLILLHQAQPHQTQHDQSEQLFSATIPVGFDALASFPEEHDRLHRMVAWNGGAATDTGNSGHGGGGGGGFIINSPSPMPTLLPPLFEQSQYLSQRGPLQSSNTPLTRAWIDSSIAAATPDHHHQHHYLPPTIHRQSSISGGIGFDSGIFSGFLIPARIQGEEEYDGVSDKPSSASSDSRQ